MGLAMQDEGKDEALDYLNLLLEYEFDFIKYWARASDYSDFVKIIFDDEFRKIVG